MIESRIQNCIALAFDHARSVPPARFPVVGTPVRTMDIFCTDVILERSEGSIGADGASLVSKFAGETLFERDPDHRLALDHAQA